MNRMVIVDNYKIGYSDLAMDKRSGKEYYLYRIDNQYFLYPEEIPDKIWMDPFDQYENSFNVKVCKPYRFNFKPLEYIVRVYDRDDVEYVDDAIDMFLKKNDDAMITKKYQIGDILVVNLVIRDEYTKKDAKRELKIMRKSESFNYPIKVKDRVFNHDFGLIRYDYVRFNWVKDLFDEGELYRTFYSLGMTLRKMVDDGISHANLHPAEITVRRYSDMVFDVSISDAEYAYKIKDGYSKRLIHNEYDAIRLLMGDAIENIIKPFIHEHPAAMLYFITGLGLEREDALEILSLYKIAYTKIEVYGYLAERLADKFLETVF